MKITITGASGFVGKNLQRYLLDKGYATKPLSLRNENWQKSIEGEVIIHLAGKAHDTTNTSAPEEYFQVNRDLTIELFQKFLNSNIRDFFYFSSVKAVKDMVDGILTENIQGNPITAYGRSKLEAEQFLLSQRLPEGKRLFIIRPCMIHGPGNKGNLNLLYKVVEKGMPWPLASFDNERSFLSIDNLSFLIQAMIESETISSGIYNFADDESLSTNELVKLISETLGRRSKLWNIPAFLISLVAQIGDRVSLPLNSERLKKLTESYVVSNAKIKNTLNLDKLPISARDGLIKTIQSFR